MTHSYPSDISQEQFSNSIQEILGCEVKIAMFWNDYTTTELTETTEEKSNNSLTGKIIGAAIEIHRTLGPGLLESAYNVKVLKEGIRRLRV